VHNLDKSGFDFLNVGTYVKDEHVITTKMQRFVYDMVVCILGRARLCVQWPTCPCT